MPNDPAGSFPMPPANNQPEPETQKEEVRLTDEVAPDLSSPPTIEPPPAPAAPPAPPTPAPVVSEPTYQPPAAPMPATLPETASKPFPIVTLLLLLISIGAIAATYFFYQQTKSLNTQLNQITQTLQQQTIKENQATITPTISLTLTPTSTTSGQTTLTPTPTLTAGSGPVWGIISDVMATAQKTYPSAQLILVKVENAGGVSQTIKYFFRQNATDRKYFYLLKETSKDLALVDQNITVFETNLLPSLNSLVTKNQLGLDLDEANTIAVAVCPTNFDCANASVTGQYVKSGTVLWQISYKPSDNSQPFYVQIDTATKKILYKSQ